MPELPEVQTTVDGLKPKVLNRTFVDVWTDWFDNLKKEEIKGKKIKNIYRRAKNIVFDLSEGYSLLVHQKMTGHLLIGNWKKDKANNYIHLIFQLSGNLVLALSDARKFAKVELWKTDALQKELSKLGPEPLEKSFTQKALADILKNKKGKIKQVLMDPKVIAGIGNIYSSEVLWLAKISPFKEPSKLNKEETAKLYFAIKKVLTKAVKLGGESFSDYRKPDGSKGGFDTERKVYKREGQPCQRCKTKIKREKVGQRSAFFCPACQQL